MASGSYHILLVEESPADARRIEKIFAEASGPRLTAGRVETLAAGLAKLDSCRVDAVLLDIALPDADGLESVRAIRRAAPETPVIVLTGLDSAELATAAVQEGAQDYLLKRDISDAGLLRCVRYAIDRRNAERDSAQARKMESIGQMAAGIAHEINTPTQYVGDSIAFLKDCFEDLSRLRSECLAVCAAVEAGASADEAAAQVRKRREEIELELLEEEIPKAFERAADGVRRIGEVVRAMREFSHPSGRDKELADLNRSIRNALTIARSQYRYVADVVTDLADLPLVLCYVAEINQALLNLIVNAAHAIEDARGGPDHRGTITVRSLVCGGCVRIEVCDDGVGVRDEIRSRVFDPFFTTKEVGRGTGQGLALAHAAIVKKHGGRLELESRLGGGSKFWFTLPIDPRERQPR